MTTPAVTLRRRRRWLLSLAALTLATMVTLGATTLAWGETLREEGRLLPGTTIAGVDVGGATRDDAVERVTARVQQRAERPVELRHDQRRWLATPAELGAVADVSGAVSDAFRHTASAGMTELARLRWSDSGADVELDVPVRIPGEAITNFLDTVARDLQQPATDARLTWDGNELGVEPATQGRRLARTAAAEGLTAAVEAMLSSEAPGAAASSALSLETSTPATTTETVRSVAETAEIDTALDRTVTITATDASWEVTPRDLGAEPDLASLLSEGTVALQLPEGALDELLDDVAAEVARAPRDAELTWGEKGPEITPERTGQQLDRAATATAVRAAVTSGADQVAATVVTGQPDVGEADLERVLVVHQAHRRVYYYDNDTLVADWPVAVGQGSSPTPTGVFTVGAKRHLPTWHNPAPDGWGSDMPASVGPGPDNPLGLRALNWNRNGADTLIRFHGTPNEGSIGQAASQGCVRMYNEDVVELYDLVPSGTTIVSLTA